MSVPKYVDRIQLGASMYGVSDVDILTKLGVATTELVFNKQKRLYVRKHFLLHIEHHTSINIGRHEFIRMFAGALGNAEFSSVRLQR